MFARKFWKLPFAAGLLACASVGLSVAHAQCGAALPVAKPSVWHREVDGARFKTAAFFRGVQEPQKATSEQGAPTIVGMWRVTFTAKTLNGAAIPNTVIDNAIAVWHGDNTEIMNSGRPPQDGNFCMGVWKQTDGLSYHLNHFAWGANDYAPGSPGGMVGQTIGPVHYQEDILLGPAGKHFTGIFTLDQYDTAGHVTTSFTGTLKATRITVDTTVEDLL